MKWQDISVDIKTLSPRAVCPRPRAIYMSWGERNTAVTTYFGEIVFFLQKWKPFSIIQIVTNSYNSSLNSFKDIWYWKYVVSQGPILLMQYCCILTYNSVALNISLKQEHTLMQYCCILTYNSVALNISLNQENTWMQYCCI